VKTVCQGAVLGEQLASPRDEICDALPGRVCADPEFEILRPIVGPDAVLVMDGFPGTQGSANHLGHHQAMFSAARDVDVAVSVDGP
jgi:hypothetical protein